MPRVIATKNIHGVMHIRDRRATITSVVIRIDNNVEILSSD